MAALPLLVDISLSSSLSTDKSLSSSSLFSPPLRHPQSLTIHTQDAQKYCFGFNNRRCLDEALKAADVMEQQGIPIVRDHAHYLVQECMKWPELECSRRVQSLIVYSGLDSVTILADHLIRLFASCGSLAEAYQAFSKVAKPSTYTWCAVIAAHANLGQGERALQLYDRMLHSGLKPDKYVYLAVLKACSVTSALKQCKLIHKQIIESGLQSDVFLGNALIDMYVKCGSLEESCAVFDELPHRDVVSWNTMIAGYCQHDGLLALDCFKRMQQEGITPDKVTFTSVLGACGSIRAITEGKLIHELVTKSELQADIVLGNALVDMYAKCGSLEDSCAIFEELPQRNVVSWGALMAGFAQHGEAFLALDCLDKMQQEGIQPDKVTFTCMLKACGSIGAITQGRLIHEQIIKCGLQSDVVVGSALVHMYAKCSSLEESRAVFDELPHRNVVSWGAMIAGYVDHGEGLHALDCFKKMQEDGIKPNKVTFLRILKGCASIGAREQGELIHKQIIETGLQSDAAMGNTLVDMYAKCGSLEKSCTVFDELVQQDVVSWGTMIAGFAQHGEGLLALGCFEKMQQEGIKPTKVTFLSVLKACGSIGAMNQGKLIHEQIIENGFQSDIAVGSALIDMYVKCGSLEEAHRAFTKLPHQDVVSWGALIGGYAHFGNFKLAKKCLEDMLLSEIKPDDMTFTSILAACSRAGLVDEGCKYFESMRKDHGIIPKTVHYNCMVDLLARAGHLNEAEKLVQPNTIAWTSLLFACRKYGNVKLARRCFDEIVQLDPHDAVGYVVMSSIYSDAGMWKDAAEVEECKQRAGAWKKPAKAWIEVNNKVHEFIVGDRSHPQSEEIYGMLKRLHSQVKDKGYEPNIPIPFMLQQMSDDEKADALCGHAERQAIAFGLLNTTAGTNIRITKNLRMCMDCHSVTKVISSIERREIIIRDAYCMHHFKEGFCSCRDYC